MKVRISWAISVIFVLGHLYLYISLIRKVDMCVCVFECVCLYLASNAMLVVNLAQTRDPICNVKNCAQSMVMLFSQLNLSSGTQLHKHINCVIPLRFVLPLVSWFFVLRDKKNKFYSQHKRVPTWDEKWAMPYACHCATLLSNF